MSITQPERRARTLSGLPPVRVPAPWWQRLLRSPWLWGCLVALPVFAASLLQMYRDVTASLRDQVNEATGGQILIESEQVNEAIALAARLALPTLAVYLLLFLLLDRLRPTTWAMKFLALGWGAAVSTYLSLVLNSWAGELMMVSGAGDPSSASRPAIYAAPFVEEVAKATILFLLAVLIRYRLVTVAQLVSLGGLSAVGFAFTENILYFFRVKVFSSMVAAAGDADAQLSNIVFLRGVLTSFGHPLFTAMTAVGLAIALRARSKWVRVVAPLVGFTAAAVLHMLFNGFASTVQDAGTLRMLYIVGLVFLAAVLFMIGRQLLRECKRIRARLADFALMGWVTARDTEVFSHLWWRSKLVWAGLFRGWQVFVATLAMERAMTELAYLRDAMTHGTVDAIGDERAKEVLEQIRGLRGIALDEPAGLTIIPRPLFGRARAWLRERRGRRRLDSFPSPVGLPYPAPVTSQGWPQPQP